MHRGSGHGLLGKNIERIARHGQWFYIAGNHGFQTCGPSDNLLTGERVEQCVRDATDLMIGTAYTLQSGGDRQRRIDLNHQVDRAISMPSSKLEVATTQRNSPRLSRSSIILRRSLETDP